MIDGANTLSCNGTVDLINNDDNTIFPQNNLQNRLDPDGIDAVHNGTGTIDTTGAGVAAQNCGSWVRLDPKWDCPSREGGNRVI